MWRLSLRSRFDGDRAHDRDRASESDDGLCCSDDGSSHNLYRNNRDHDLDLGHDDGRNHDRVDRDHTHHDRDRGHDHGHDGVDVGHDRDNHDHDGAGHGDVDHGRGSENASESVCGCVDCDGGSARVPVSGVDCCCSCHANMRSRSGGGDSSCDDCGDPRDCDHVPCLCRDRDCPRFCSNQLSLRHWKGSKVAWWMYLTHLLRLAWLPGL